VSAPAREEVLEGLRGARREVDRLLRGPLAAARGGLPEAGDALDRAIAYLESLKAPEDYFQEAAGQVMAFVDMARTLSPPAGLGGRGALATYADFAEHAARNIFGEGLWRGLRGETASAARQEGVPRPPLPPRGTPT